MPEFAPATSQVSPTPDAKYIPIRDYALIGDCHGAALVSRAGSIDWCCLRRFDADPVCCRILDADKGGFLSVRPTESFDAQREYLPGTNVLRTTFTTAGGKLEVTDFMPVGRKPGSGLHNYVTLNAPHWVVRLIECVQGPVALRIGYRPTVAFAGRKAALAASQGGVVVEDGPGLYADLDFSVEGDTARAERVLEPEERMALALTAEHVPRPPAMRRIAELFDITRAFWEEWSDYCRYDGPYRDAVLRSALALKLLTYAPSGALVAAPTTSLPEEIGGERNWDYRYCWLRDATFTLYALSALGYSGEARRFADFLQRSCEATHPRVQIMYGIAGESALAETALGHLEGYRASRPVRVGNGAHTQQQLDVYGEVLDWAYLAGTLGSRFDRKTRRFLCEMAGFIAAHWQEPGQGMWEMRGAARQHVFGKIMCWVALDRALRMFGDNPRFQQTRREIEHSIRQDGIDSNTGSLRQAYDEPGMDAVLLLAPLVDFPLAE